MKINRLPCCLDVYHKSYIITFINVLLATNPIVWYHSMPSVDLASRLKRVIDLLILEQLCINRYKHTTRKVSVRLKRFQNKNIGFQKNLSFCVSHDFINESFKQFLILNKNTTNVNNSKRFACSLSPPKCLNRWELDIHNTDHYLLVNTYRSCVLLFSN